jgi:hypothetical protein
LLGQRVGRDLLRDGIARTAELFRKIFEFGQAVTHGHDLLAVVLNVQVGPDDLYLALTEPEKATDPDQDAVDVAIGADVLRRTDHEWLHYVGAVLPFLIFLGLGADAISLVLPLR